MSTNRAGTWLLAMSVVFIVLGVLAIGEPLVAGLAVAILAGWILVFGGVAHAISAFRGGDAGRTIWQVLLAFIYILGGFYFLTHPLLGLGTLTLFLAGILVAEAVLELVRYSRSRTEQGAGWRLVNAVITIVLALMIWEQWPSSAVWAIGTLVGVNLLMTGFSQMMIALAFRRLSTHVHA
jgi:uncharacterized membrane protein HdeD (DUF308 family)